MTRPTDPCTALLTAALTAAERGWHIFPLVPDGKRPAIRAWEDRATTDPERIRRCWNTGAYGIGIACGPSNLVVVDLDTPKHEDDIPPAEWAEPGVHEGADVLAVLCERHGQPFPCETYIASTGRDGLHLCFTAPASPQLRNTSGLLGWKIDTRAAGGYVVAAGSTVDGRPYTVVHEADPDALPGWLAGLLAPSRPDVATLLVRLTRPSGYAEAALRGELERLLAAQAGERNTRLHRAAFALGQLVAVRRMPEALAVAALQTAGEAIGLPARECATTIASGLRGGIRHPRRGAI